jgi:prefoldin subunit 5
VTTSEWGRVAEDRTVYVRTADGERPVGQYPEGSPEEALAFYAKRYDELAGSVHLLEQRVQGALISPDDAAEAVKAMRAQVVEANAVGDLTALVGRLDALGPVISVQRQARKAERDLKIAAAKTDKERIVGDAEKIAEGNDWRNGANRLRQLLDEWKALPRIDRASDDQLWRRFSTARTSYTRRRKSHFAEQNEKRDAARVVKQRLVKDAEGLSKSTDWGPTASAYRDLMREWKAAGPAPREVEDELWGRFRGAQDTFFGARDEAMAAQDSEYSANAEAKEKLLVEAEALVPVTDLEAAKRAIRDLSERWDAIGKVPRDKIRPLEDRMKAVEQAIRSIEQEQWRRSDPEKSARADDMVAKLEEAIAKVEKDLDAARTSGNQKKVSELEENLASRRSFLEMAQRASADYSG